MRRPEDELDHLRESGLLRGLRRIESIDGRTVTIDGARFLNFSSNDYLGLSQHPALTDAAAQALRDWGAGSTASRLICGSLAPHHDLEETIAELKGTEAAVAFATGYATAVGATTSLVGKGDTIILDKLSHASLVDGARLSGATIRVFPHNNLDKLERLLTTTRANAPGDGRILIVTESVFSMDGDLAALGEIIALKDQHGALLLLDEAHAIGVLGPTGQGLAESLSLQSHIDLQLGTLGKAVGSGGGYIATTRAMADLLVNKARSFIYSTAPPPAQSAAAAAGLRLIASQEGTALRRRLQDHLLHFAKLTGTPEPASAIVPIILGTNEEALAASQSLLDAGLLVPAIRYPTVPRNSARLRVTISAAHDEADIIALADHINSL